MQSTNHVMMMEPLDFRFNPETEGTNQYQVKDEQSNEAIQKQAVLEFRALRDALVENGVAITSVLGQKGSPDDIFCNNWVSTHKEGRMVLYPMLAPNRRIERRNDLLEILGKSYETALDLSPYEENGHFLESTGALGMDRINKVAYIALSERADKELAQKFCDEMGYAPIFFNTRNHAGKPVYHTDVLMYIGSGYIGLCTETIVEEDRARVIAAVEKTHELVDLSMNQMRDFCGNALEVVGQDGQKMLAMSTRAYEAMTDYQLDQIAKFTSGIIHAPIPTIEKYGGGSARCMLLELH